MVGGEFWIAGGGSYRNGYLLVHLRPKSHKCLQTEDSEEDLEREIGLGGDELSEMMVPGQL